mgnify:CR=1 FL=1|jgi:hypothetical protein
MMDSISDSNKTHDRSDYKQFKTTCIICLETGKKKSKQFNSIYSLGHHLKTTHDREDEISARITKRQILQTARAVLRALDWNMLVDLKV